MILGIVSLAPVDQGSRYSTFLDALLLSLPLVLAGGFAWDAPAAGPLRAALWTGAFVCLALGVSPSPQSVDRIGDGHQIIIVLLALSTATAAQLVGPQPVLRQWLGAPGE